MAWSYPVYRAAKKAIFAAANKFNDLARDEANAKRLADAVAAIKPTVVAALKAALPWFLSWVSTSSPVVQAVCRLLIETVYEAIKPEVKAAAVPIRAVNVTNEIIWPNQMVEVIGPPAPETIVDVTDGSAQSISYTTTDDIMKAKEIEQAEPGNESMESDHAIGFHAMPYIVFPREQAEPGDTR